MTFLGKWTLRIRFWQNYSKRNAKGSGSAEGKWHQKPGYSPRAITEM